MEMGLFPNFPYSTVKNIPNDMETKIKLKPSEQHRNLLKIFTKSYRKIQSPYKIQFGGT